MAAFDRRAEIDQGVRVAYSVGETVFVPTSLVGRTDSPAALGRFEIAEVNGPDHPKSLRVTLSDDEDPDDGWVASSLVHSHIGITLVRIGDLGSEAVLLDPLAKSLNHFLRLLVGDDYFNMVYLRTRVEFEQFWRTAGGNMSHLILLAHGRKDAMRFVGAGPPGFEDWMTGTELAEAFGAEHGFPPSHVVSLSCETGYAEFSQPVSSAATCRDCIAPMHSVHGAIASQFCQTLFIGHLLHGRRWPIAFRHARQATPGTATFRLWENGGLREGATGA